jgi:Nucleotidyl transferase AbiEii toxin, Type IV TA system
MKDFYDIWVLSILFPFSGGTLLRAIRSTFERRGTAIPANVPAGLTDAFGLDDVKRAQWDGFRRRLAEARHTAELPEVISRLREFLWPVLQAASSREGFEREWNPPDGWRSASRD